MIWNVKEVGNLFLFVSVILANNGALSFSMSSLNILAVAHVTHLGIQTLHQGLFIEFSTHEFVVITVRWFVVSVRLANTGFIFIGIVTGCCMFCVLSLHVVN